MERNTVTTVYSLKIGDRFYRAGDKNKTVLVKVEHKFKQTNFQTYKHWVLPASIHDRTSTNDNTIAKFATAIKSETSVIYLRSKEATA